jgi:LEA14-like dessication related protein
VYRKARRAFAASPARLTPSLAVVLMTLMTLVAGCASLPGDDFDDPEVELVGLEPVAGAGMEARFRVALRIVNPNDTALDIRGMAYEVYLRERRVLSGVSDQPLKVGPYSETTAEVEVAAGMLSSLALLRDLMDSPPGASIPYQLKAKLSRGGIGGTLRVTREGSIDLGAPR